MSPESPLVWHWFPVFPCFELPWQFWRVSVRYFVKCPSVGVYLMFCHDLSGINVLGEDRKCPSHRIRSEIWDVHMTSLGCQPSMPGQMGFAALLHCTLHIPFQTTKVVPILKGSGGLSSTSWGGKSLPYYSEFFYKKELSIFLHLVIHLFNHLLISV